MSNIGYLVVSILFFITVLFTSTSYGVENYGYFTDAQSLLGPTGNIQTFSTKTLPHKQFSMGVHKFFMGFTYGFFPNTEAGISFDLKELTPLLPLDHDSFERKKGEISIHSKYRILKQEKNSFDISLAQRRGVFYLSAAKYFSSLSAITLQGGISIEGNRFLTYFSFAQNKSWEQFLFDYEPIHKQYNIGWRFLLAPEMKLDLFLIDFTRIKNVFFDNFVFGLTLTG